MKYQRLRSNDYYQKTINKIMKCIKLKYIVCLFGIYFLFIEMNNDYDYYPLFYLFYCIINDKVDLLEFSDFYLFKMFTFLTNQKNIPFIFLS